MKVQFEIPDEAVAGIPGFVAIMTAFVRALTAQLTASVPAGGVSDTDTLPGVAVNADTDWPRVIANNVFHSNDEYNKWLVDVKQRDDNLADTSSVPGPIAASAGALIAIDFGQRTEWFPVDPGQVFEIVALADGRVSATTESGSFPVFIDLVPSIDSTSLVWSTGGGGSSLFLTKGQHAFCKFDGEEPQKMRVELL